MPTIKLQQVKNFDKLLKYLETELGWPVEGREIDDIAFPFDLESDLGLDKNEVAKVRHVYRLKKMHKKQPFGIFFVDFEGKKMPVSVLKRILRNLALKRKANAKAADQLAWDVEDLIFISAVGEEKDSTREISFAHFRKEPDNRHVLKVMAWDGGDTPLKMDHLDDVLHEFLRFPDDTNDVDAWRKSWTAAFRTGLRQNIRRSEELAQALAALAMRINKEALSLIKKESANGPLKTLHAGFKDALIHDLTEEAFTDCYAQTITYGLLTAAITKVNQAGVKDLTSTSVLEMVPSTNPFLKDILSSFLEAGGRGQKGIDFDDLGVQDVIDLLRAESTDLPNILRDFGNLTQDEDPVIHFYETFLKIYNKDERVKRGAFYTPRPVVSYIVRSVDELLRKEFGLEDGLADTTTWGEMIKRNPAIKLPPLTDNPGEKKTIKETEPFIQILDPATGTATFLVEVINIIEKTVKAKAWAKLKNGPYDHDQHSKRDEVLKAWNEYVPEHLLKRLHAYEIMMAPYVIAHMKVGLKLAETGYQFATEERARIYLTNALEQAKDHSEELQFDVPALAIEAAQVNDIKRSVRFTVVIGNPPYSNFGHANVNDWIDGQMLDFWGNMKGESKVNLYDDYIKFIRLGFKVRPGLGVIGMITNRSFLDGSTQREMRNYMIRNSDGARILDLYRGIYDEKKDVDENVFDITTGVAISLWWRKGGGGTSSGFRFGRLVGSYQEKVRDFLAPDVSELVPAELRPIANDYLLIPVANELTVNLKTESLAKLFRESTTGVQTNRDALTIDLDSNLLFARVEKFSKGLEQAKEVLASCKVPETKFWNASMAVSELRENGVSRGKINPYMYRPFDLRHIYFDSALVHCPRALVSRAVIGHDTLCVLASRGVDMPANGVAFITRYAADKRAINSARGEAKIFPCTIPSSAGEGLFERAHESNLVLPGGWKFSSDEDEVIAVIYAILNAPSYLKVFADQLRLDYPLIPTPASAGLFKELSIAGKILIDAHTLDESVPLVEEFPAIGKSMLVEAVSWQEGAIWLNKQKQGGFMNVTEEMWNLHIGGYRVCKKWLDERSGKILTIGERSHFVKILNAAAVTLDARQKIEAIINTYGGWPKAFQ